MRSFFSSRTLRAAAPLVVGLVFSGCGIDADGVAVTSGGPGGTQAGAGRAGSASATAGRGGAETVAGASGTGGGGGLAGASSEGGNGGGGGAGDGGVAGDSGSAGAAGGGGTSPVGGAGGKSGASGTAGSASGGGGNAGKGGVGGMAGAGASGAAGQGGTGMVGGAAGASANGGNAGVAGAAGTGGTAGAGNGGGGSGGSAGTSGAAGEAGSGGAGGQPPVLCGNGRLDVGETCDDGSGTTGSTACKACQIPCDNGGFSTNGRCYFRGDTFPINRNELTADARAQRAGGPATLCVAEGAHLASLGDATENTNGFLDQLGNHFGTSTNGQLLLGVVTSDDTKNSSNRASDWIWLDGTVPADGRWSPTNPDADTPGASCGTLMGKRLNDIPCDSADLKGYLCEREPQCAVRTAPEAKALPGYLSNDGHCWVALATKTSWHGAIQACTSLKFLDGTGTGSIAVFTTKARLAELPGVGLFETWVGASQAKDDNEDSDAKKRAGWTWLVGGEAYKGFESMWESGKPNDKGGLSNEDAATLTELRLFDDDDPADNKRPLCEVSP